MQADLNNLCICLTIENNSSKNHLTVQNNIILNKKLVKVE